MNVSVRELKARLSEYLRRVQQGEEVVITRHGRPVGRIVPATDIVRKSEAEVVRELRSLPWVRPGRGGELPVPSNAWAFRKGEKMVSDVVVEDRG